MAFCDRLAVSSCEAVPSTAPWSRWSNDLFKGVWNISALPPPLTTITLGCGIYVPRRRVYSVRLLCGVGIQAFELPQRAGQMASAVGCVEFDRFRGFRLTDDCAAAAARGTAVPQMPPVLKWRRPSQGGFHGGAPGRHGRLQRIQKVFHCKTYLQRCSVLSNAPLRQRSLAALPRDRIRPLLLWKPCSALVQYVCT